MITFNLPGLETGTKIDHNGSVVRWGDSIEELLEHIRTSDFNITTKEKLIETINKITNYDCRYLFTEKTISGEISYYIIKRAIDGRYVVCDTPIVKIGDSDVAAQIMFVIGTNGGGLWHPNWNQNLKFYHIRTATT